VSQHLRTSRKGEKVLEVKGGGGREKSLNHTLRKLGGLIREKGEREENWISNVEEHTRRISQQQGLKGGEIIYSREGKSRYKRKKKKNSTHARIDQKKSPISKRGLWGAISSETFGSNKSNRKGTGGNSVVGGTKGETTPDEGHKPTYLRRG